MSPKFILVIFFLFNFFLVSAQERGNSEIAKANKVSFLDDKYSMSKVDALELMKGYREKRWKRHKRVGFLGRKYDAGSCWFDIGKLKSFTEHINDRLKTRDTLGALVTGYRFYYITYGKKKEGDHVPPELAKLGSTKKIHSLLIVATELKDGYQTDIVDEKGNKVAAFILKIVNEGTLCPPLPLSECKGATLGREVYREVYKESTL